MSKKLNKIRILIVDDDEFKSTPIFNLVNDAFYADIWVEESIRGAVDYARQKSIDLLILDMSLPTFGISPLESGGTQLGFGGLEVLHNLDRYEIDCDVIVISQYTEFMQGDETRHISSLLPEVKALYGGELLAVIYFDLIEGGWKPNLKKVMVDRYVEFIRDES